MFLYLKQLFSLQRIYTLCSVNLTFYSPYRHHPLNASLQSRNQPQEFESVQRPNASLTVLNRFSKKWYLLVLLDYWTFPLEMVLLVLLDFWTFPLEMVLLVLLDFWYFFSLRNGIFGNLRLLVFFSLSIYMYFKLKLILSNFYI